MRHSPPWLKITLALIVIAVFATGVIVMIRGADNSSAAGAQGPSPSPSKASVAPSADPSSNASSATACPQAKRLPGKENDFKNRVFDFEEAWLIHDPKTLVKALEERGDPKGLVSQDLLERMQAQAEQAAAEDTSEVAVLDRVQSKFTIDDSSDDAAQIIYVTPVYTTCRDGKVLNDPVTGDEHMSTWTKDESPDGAYRVVEQVS